MRRFYIISTRFTRSRKYELAADATNEQMIDAAIELCCEYVAVNTKLSEYGLTLSASEKALGFE